MNDFSPRHPGHQHVWERRWIAPSRDLMGYDCICGAVRITQRDRTTHVVRVWPNGDVEIIPS